MKSNLEELWNYEFHPKLQEYNMQLFLKYILSGVIVVRTFTTHIFLALYVVMLWPAIFEERPSLMVPWLMVGSVRYVALNVVTLVTGSYICISQKGHHPICFDFFLSQIIDHGPSFYAWLTIWSYYKDLQGQCEEKQKRKSVQLEIATRRRRAKLMNSSQYEERLEDGNVLEDLISQSTLSTLIHKLESDSWSSSLSRSLDSLLKLQSTKDVTEEIMFSDSMVDDMQSTSINQRVMKILDINEDELRKILLGRDSASLINTHEERQYSDSQNGDNMEKIIQQFASDRHKALVAKNKEKRKR
ncbi:hypothetical protein NQ317_005549 [Molorchus minor]|uniref:Uncharacterized protein n=1 Tax=Molorchus minor TaxID=1323400 RepID=A0ABQ9JXT2_9CUCU|nr:hypothetical protein NQ317_005549 [Molorchus minor]